MIVIGLNDELEPFLYDMNTKSFVSEGIVTHISYSSFPRDCVGICDNDRIMNYISNFDISGDVKNFVIKTPKNYSYFGYCNYNQNQETDIISADISVWVKLYDIIENFAAYGIEKEDDQKYTWFGFLNQVKERYFQFPGDLLDAYLRDILKIKRKHTILSKTMTEWISFSTEPSMNILIKSASKR